MPNAADNALLLAGHKALDMIAAIYKHIDAIEEAGGMGDARGREVALDLIFSLQDNRQSIGELVAAPLMEALRLKAN